jgi:hypothetical protein
MIWVAVVAVCWIVVWVLFDARSRDWSLTGYRGYSPVFWAAAVALIGLVFLPVYLVVRRRSRPNGKLRGLKRCPECAELVQGDALVCRFCRFRFVVQRLQRAA